MSEINTNINQNNDSYQEGYQKINKTNLLKNKKRHLCCVIGLIIVLLVGILGYKYWTGTPLYSLKMVAKAVEKHDLINFKKYVDVDSVVSRMIDQSIEYEMSSEPDDAMNDFAMGIVQLIKPKMVDMVKDEIYSYVEKGTFEEKETSDDELSFSLSDIFKNTSDVQSIQFKGVDYVKKSDNVALVGLKIYNCIFEKELIVEVKMRDMKKYWQVAEINNFAALIKKMDELKEEKLAQLNKPILEEINKTVVVKDITLDKISDDFWGFSNSVIINVAIEVLDNKKITEIGGIILSKNKDEQILLDMPVDLTKVNFTEKVNTVQWEKEINPFISEDEEFFATEDLTTTFEWKYIKFADGTELEVLDELP
ncbi:MAG: hypothetical protein ACOX2N_04955 [Peptococcia bacterium]